MSGFLTDLQAKVKTALSALNTEVPIKFTVSAASAAAARAALGPLGGQTVPVKFKVDPASAAAAKAALGPMAGEKISVRFVVDSAGVAQAVAAEKVIADTATAAARAQKAQADTAARAAAATKTLSIVASTGAGRFGFLRTQLNLFGGALKGIPFLATVGGFHLIANAALEVASTVIPAGIALAAFGAAAAGPVGDVFHQLQNIHTVTVATGQSLAPLTGGLTRLQNAVRPQVYQLLGDALTVISRKTGLLTTLATGAGTVLDQLGARLTRALESSGFAVFLAHAVSDLAKFADMAGNLGGILGNLLKALPGYGQTLLNLADGFTKVAEAVSGSAITQGVLKAGLAFHGAFLYLGLGATVAAVAVQRGLGLISNLSQATAERLGGMGAAGRIAAGGISRFGIAAGTAAALPWGWISLAAVGIGILAYKILTAKDATQQWLAAQQAFLQQQPAVRGYTTLLSDQTAVTARLATAQSSLTQATKAFSVAGQVTNRGVVTGMGAQRQAAQAYQDSLFKVRDLTAGQQVLIDQSSLYNIRLGKLAVAFGGVGRAQGLLIASGITMKQMLDKSATGWATIITQVESTIKAYAVMGQTGGALGADMNALNIAASDQVAAMTKLNQAWDATMAVVSGGQPAFITFEQDILSVAQSWKGAGGTARIATNTFTGAAAAARKSGASMTGLNAASLQLRATWQTAFTGASTLIDALRIMSSASPGGFPSLQGAVKDVVGQLLPLGRLSGVTRTQMMELAQQIDPNITSFHKLTKWLGNTKDAGKDLNAIVARMGINLGNLAADAANMTGTLRKDLTGIFDLAKVKASGAGAALAVLGTDMGNLGAVSAGKFHADMLTAAKDLVKSGLSASDAKTFIAGMTGKVLDAGATASQKHADFVILYNDFRKMGQNAKTAADNARDLTGWLGKVSKNWKATEKITATGSWTITGPTGFRAQGPGGHGGPVPAAAGGRVTGGVPGKDSVLIAAMPDEAVLSVPHTRMLAPLLAAIGVPGFASGGIVPSYSGSLGGVRPWAASNWNATQNAMASSLAAVVAQAIRQARAAAFAGGGSIVADAMHWLGKIPYVWGGTSIPGGADCSGFTQAIYARHGISAPRTSEAQGAWVRRSGPTPGGLAFYNSPAGGPPPGHVAIVGTGGMVISQGGGLGPQLVPLGSMPLMFTGIPPGGLPKAAAVSRPGGGGGNNPIHGALGISKTHTLDQGGWLYPGEAGLNRTGSPELVLNASQVRQMGGGGPDRVMHAKLDRMIALLGASTAGQTGAAVGSALDGFGRRQLYQGMYSPRGG